MDSVIIIPSTNSSAQTAQAMQAAADKGLKARLCTAGSGGSLKSDLAAIGGRRILVALADCVSTKQIDCWNAELQQSSASALWVAPLQIGSDIYESTPTEPDEIAALLIREEALPFAAMIVDRNATDLFIENEGSVAAQLLSALVQAVSEAHTVQSLSSPASLDSEPAELTLSQDDRARLLTLIVNACNIEEIFPRYDWNCHKEESLAAAYHTLAAQFIRFGDFSSALECLTHSDSLEESPRNFALRGILAFQRGEMLGAVAHLVSSLQQYEIRKRNDGSHYLTFEPRNIEQINSELSAGLAALKDQDNGRAFSHFAAAIRDFDDFYASMNLPGFAR